MAKKEVLPLAQSTLEKLMFICIPNYKRDEQIYFLVVNEKEYCSPGSLKSVALKAMFNKALKEKEIRQKVEEIVKENPLPFSHLHYLLDCQELFNLALRTSLLKLNGLLAIEIRKSKCLLLSFGEPIIELSIGEDYRWPIYFVNVMMKHSSLDFRLSVSDIQNDSETRKESLEKLIAMLGKNGSACPGSCNVGCYLQYPFEFSNHNGMVIYFRSSRDHKC